MYFQADRTDLKIRHTCRTDDGTVYGWERHNGRDFGEEFLRDPELRLKMNFSYVKIDQHKWAVRVNGSALDASSPAANVSLMFYWGVGDGYKGMDGVEHAKHAPFVVDPPAAGKPASFAKGIEGPFCFHGEARSPSLGRLALCAPTLHGARPKATPQLDEIYGAPADTGRTHYMGIEVPAQDVWQVQQRVTEALRESAQAPIRRAQKFLQHQARTRDPNAPPPEIPRLPALYLSLPDKIEPRSNVYVFQRTLTVPFEVELVFTSRLTADEEAASLPAARQSSGSALTTLVQQRAAAFDARFESIFHLRTISLISISILKITTVLIIHSPHHHHPPQEHGPFTEGQLAMGRRALSDLIGGMGRPGSRCISGPNRPPCSRRPLPVDVPRGFWWDEGFHQLLLQAWDPDLSLDVVAHWVSLIDETGWVAREQILGEEAASAVPREFRGQSNTVANPPSFAFLLQRLLDQSEPAASQQQQQQQQQPGGTVLASPEVASLYDGPGVPFPVRPETAAPATAEMVMARQQDEGGHVDVAEFLRAIYQPMRRYTEWMYQSQRVPDPSVFPASPIDGVPTKPQEAFRWRGRTPNHCFASGLDDYPRGPVLADPDRERHVDLHGWMVVLTEVMSRLADRLGDRPQAQIYTARLARLRRDLALSHWDPARGCVVNVFPLLLGLVPGRAPAAPSGGAGVSPVLSAQLNGSLAFLRSPAKLWSPFGVRSLARSDWLYRTQEDYWRGSVWINLNYLALRALHRYATELADVPGVEAVREAYQGLRSNLIANLDKEFQRTGMLWEHYSGEDGHGQGSHPFHGWSVLGLLAMAEIYQ
ncbi:putative Mannosyl-oligosaccharide glucosidase [Paratrimastix pyriformis]|uniref:Mannosyl-oligosaccharide glucosidase n=1 Tax=Paratrimastix pyriformis TaxID=342808 RepID=A0ABQ8UWK2_9EUKA|nr:putative Mannosyl-oligosaccharide glucosidase [Paratrimastix pyriformis]